MNPGAGGGGGGAGGAPSLRSLTEPTYDPATDGLLYNDDLQGYANDAAFMAAGYFKYQVNGTATFQTTGGRSGFPKCVRQLWTLSASCGVDAEVGFGRNVPQTLAPFNGAGLGYVFTMWQAFDSGFVSDWLSTPRINTTCSGTALKGHLITRDPSGNGRGRLGIYHQYLDYLGEVQDGQQGTMNQPAWEVHVGPLRTDGIGSYQDQNALYYISNMNNQLHGTDKSPKAIYDGNAHRFTQAYINESVNGAGDGFIGVWVDGLPVIWYNGLGAGLQASSVWTRVGVAPDDPTVKMGLDAFEVNPTLNASAPQAQGATSGGLSAFVRP